MMSRLNRQVNRLSLLKGSAGLNNLNKVKSFQFSLRLFWGKKNQHLILPFVYGDSTVPSLRTFLMSFLLGIALTHLNVTKSTAVIRFIYLFCKLKCPTSSPQCSTVRAPFCCGVGFLWPDAGT